MVVRRIVPDVYTDYDDGRIGAVAPALANVEAKVGPADGGMAGQLYVLSGPDAKGQAKTVFQGGPLLRAIEEAFDAGSSTIYAWRIGGGEAAFIDLDDNIGRPALRLTAGASVPAGTQIEIDVDRAIDQAVIGLYAIDATAGLVKKFDAAGAVLSSFDYTAETADARGVGWQFNAGESLWLLGVDGTGVPRLWHYLNGAVVAADTIDLSGAIQVGEEVTGIILTTTDTVPGEAPAFAITTNKAFYGFVDFNTAPTTPETYTPYSSWGLPAVDAQDASLSYGIAVGSLENFEPDGLFVADPTARKIYKLTFQNAAVEEIDVSGLAGSDTMRGLTFDLFSRVLYVALGAGVDGRIVALDPTNPAPAEADILFAYPVGGDVTGLGIAALVVNWSTTISIREAVEGATAYVFTAGSLPELVAQLNVGQTLVTGESLSNAQPAATPGPVLLEAAGGGAPTNADYIHGLELTTAYPEIAWIHPVGATSQALWVATLTHCRSMLDDFLSERFAVLETAPFTSSAAAGSAAYLADLQNYVDAIATQMALIADRNAAVFPGGAEFLGSDGTQYVGPITSACGGVMAGLSVQKSLINKQVPNVLKLVPEFTPGHLQQLIQARTNPVRRKPGRGFIIGHSLTAAAPGSDYSRVNDLRAVYYGAKRARLAAQLYVGEENDTEGEGLQRLESAMARPLEVMRDAPEPQVDDFELRARSNANDRLLGDVYVELGIRPLRAMETIYTTVYLK